VKNANLEATQEIRNMPRWISLLSSIILMAGILASMIGCGGERAYPVRGQLVYEDGQPVKELAGFTVTFTSETLHKSARGNIDENGSFQLAQDGAFPGQYKVILTQPHPNPERGESRKPVVDEAYEHPAKSTLTADVEPKNNEFTFTLKRIGKK
jgi:hypothetical protein